MHEPSREQVGEQTRRRQGKHERPHQHDQVVPNVAESMASRQLANQQCQRPRQKRRVESRAEPLHRAALDAKGCRTQAEQDDFRDEVRPGAHGPPAGRVRDEDGDFDRQGGGNRRGPHGVVGFG